MVSRTTSTRLDGSREEREHFREYWPPGIRGRIVGLTVALTVSNPSAWRKWGRPWQRPGVVRSRKAWLFCALTLLSREVHAMDQVRVALRFQAPPGCSDRETFAAGLRNRSKRIQIVGADERGLVVSVRLAPSDQLVHGELRLTDDRKETELRAVDGADCAEVVEALSLTAALAIERTVMPESDESSNLEPPAPQPEHDPRGVPDRPSAPALESAPARVNDDGSSGAGVYPTQLLIAGLASERVASQTSVGFSLGVLKRLRLSRGFAPQVGLTGTYVPAEFMQPTYRLSATYVAANLQACPVVGTLVSGLSLAPCALLEVGALTVSDRTVEISSPSRRPLVSIGGVGRANLEVTRQVALDFELALLGTFPSRHYTSEVPVLSVGRTAPVVWQLVFGWLFGW